MLNPKKLCNTYIPKLFDCWADPVAHLLLLKSSMLQLIIIGPSFGRVSGPVMTLVWFLLILCVQTLQAKYRHTLGCQRPNLLIPTLSTFCSIIIALKAHGPLPTFQSRSRYFEHRFFISPEHQKSHYVTRLKTISIRLEQQPWQAMDGAVTWVLMHRIWRPAANFIIILRA